MVIEVREERFRPGAFWVVSVGEDGKARPVRGPMSEKGALRMAKEIVDDLRSAAKPTGLAPESNPCNEENQPWIHQSVSKFVVIGAAVDAALLGLLIGMLIEYLR